MDEGGDIKILSSILRLVRKYDIICLLAGSKMNYGIKIKNKYRR